MIPAVKSAIACAAVAAAAFAAVAAPFRLPPGASAEKPVGDAKGWHCNGTLGLSFQQAQRRLAAAVAAAGWTHLHTIELGKDRVLEAWSRADEELTVMIWRISPGESAFSYGVSKKAGADNFRGPGKVGGR